MNTITSLHIAQLFRLSICYSEKIFVWLISNLYELHDREEETVKQFIKYEAELSEKKSKELYDVENLPFYGDSFFFLFKKLNSDLTDANCLSLALVCQSFVSWKKGYLTMEEYYEIRDMLVAFDLAITETFANIDVLIKEYELLSTNKQMMYIKKIGKVIIDEVPDKTIIEGAFEQIYFDEYDNG